MGRKRSPAGMRNFILTSVAFSQVLGCFIPPPHDCMMRKTWGKKSQMTEEEKLVHIQISSVTCFFKPLSPLRYPETI